MTVCLAAIGSRICSKIYAKWSSKTPSWWPWADFTAKVLNDCKKKPLLALGKKLLELELDRLVTFLLMPANVILNLTCTHIMYRLTQRPAQSISSRTAAHGIWHPKLAMYAISRVACLQQLTFLFYVKVMHVSGTKQLSMTAGEERAGFKAERTPSGCCST